MLYEVITHHLGRTGRIAAAHQVVDGGAAEVQEVVLRVFQRLGLGRTAVDLALGQPPDQGVVLVRAEGLLTAALAAQEQPAERRRRRPQLLLQEGQDAVQKRLAEHRDHAPHAARFGPLLDERPDDQGNLAREAVEPLEVP